MKFESEQNFNSPEEFTPKKMYWRLAKEFHSDRGGDNEKMIELNDVYEEYEKQGDASKLIEIYNQHFGIKEERKAKKNFFDTQEKESGGTLADAYDEYLKRLEELKKTQEELKQAQDSYTKKMEEIKNRKAAFENLRDERIRHAVKEIRSKYAPTNEKLRRMQESAEEASRVLNEALKRFKR